MLNALILILTSIGELTEPKAGRALIEVTNNVIEIICAEKNPALLELLPMYYQERINMVMVLLFMVITSMVTWCIRSFTWAEARAGFLYDPRYARWSLDDLPIIPNKWQLKPRADVKNS